jgi:hypothetical protein
VAKYITRGKSSSLDPKTVKPKDQKKDDKKKESTSPDWVTWWAPRVFWGSFLIMILIMMRWIPFNWGWMVFFAILGGGASLFIKKNKLVGFFRWVAAGILIVTMLSAWFAPDLPKAVEGYEPGTATPSPAPQEQVATPSTIPTPEAPRSTRTFEGDGIKRVTLEDDGEFQIPAGDGDLHLLIPNLGKKDGSEAKSVYLTISGVEYIAMGSEEFRLPQELKGKTVKVDFFPGKKTNVKKLYSFWKNEPGGQADKPVIVLKK